MGGRGSSLGKGRSPAGSGDAPTDPAATEQASAEPEMPAVAEKLVVTAPVSGQMSAAPLLPNDWGDPTKKDINFHDDGEIGSAIKAMGEDARMDVDGEPVANVLGRLATDITTGRRTAADGVEAYKELRDR